MKRFRILIVALASLLLMTNSTYADQISKEKAIQIASNFMKRSTGSVANSMNLAATSTSEDLPSISTKGTKESDPYYYIITNETGKGFVIVTADDDYIPVLGYSYDSELDPENIPDNMEYWLCFLRDQLKWAKENGITENESIIKRCETVAPKVIKYLETAKWNQTSPYNLQCPKSGNTTCPTGCVATAMAIIMRYYQWPNYGIGSTTAYKCNNNTITVASRNLNHKYNWDKMPLSYSGVTDTEKRNEVAALMADIGAAIQLEYSPSSTGGYVIYKEFVNNFSYSSDMYMEYRDHFYDYEWIALLKAEIDKGRPIRYGGQDTGGKGGHAFILDGYNDQNYFHVNWGWGGSGNNYFLISALNVDGLKFNTYQRALLNFYPADGTNPDPARWIELYAPGLKCSTKTFTKNVSFKIDLIEIINVGYKTFSGNIILALVDNKGEIIEKLKSLSAKNLDYIGSISNTSVTITSDIKDGYRIRAFYQSTGDTKIYPMWREGGSASITQEILVAPDVDPDLGEGTSLKYDNSNNKIIITTLEGAQFTLFDNGGSEVSEGVSQDGKVITIDLSKLSSEKYKIKLQKLNEVKELEFSVKPIN